MSIGWGDLFASGSIVDLNISLWSGRIQILEADLGIRSDAVTRALSLGHHRLVPAESFEAITKIAAKTKDSVDKHGMVFPFIRGARFIPEKNLVALVSKLEDHESKFAQAVNDFASIYESTADAMKPVIRRALEDATHALDKTAVNTTVDAAMERLIKKYPSADDVRDHFSMKWSIYAIRGPATDGIKQDVNEVSDVLKGMVSNLRGEVIEKLEGVLAVVSKGGTVQQRTIDSAIAVLDRVDGVNVFRDKVLEEQVGVLRQIIAGMAPGKKAENDGLLTKIEDVKKALETDIDKAVKEAEQRLTGLGRREIEV